MGDKICVVGAGSSGLTAVKALLEQELDFDCFEMGSDIGGNWRYGNDNGRSSAYASLHIDTSKERMAYSDMPMPDEYPQFPHHSQVLDYFGRYAQKFGLKEHITFRTKVERIEPADDQQSYRITTTNLDTGESKTEVYRAVVVCNGHHWREKWPTFEGEFSGEMQHSHTYREPYPFKDKRVLVVGIGNSGVDLSCDISHVAEQVYLSTRRSAYIIPRYIMGTPTDQWITARGAKLPFGVQRFLYKILLKLSVGDQENYGIPKPKHSLLTEHPTMSAELPFAVARGDVVMKPNVAELRGDEVAFVDGTSEAIDHIVYATGYQISFPFFEPGFLAVEENDIALYRKVVDPQKPNLFFIGLIQPIGAIMPLAEIQAKWVAGLLSGAYRLPDKVTMQKEILKAQRHLRKRYVNSARHTVQVDFWPYKDLIEREMAMYAVENTAVGAD